MVNCPARPITSKCCGGRFYYVSQGSAEAMAPSVKRTSNIFTGVCNIAGMQMHYTCPGLLVLLLWSTTSNSSGMDFITKTRSAANENSHHTDNVQLQALCRRPPPALSLVFATPGLHVVSQVSDLPFQTTRDVFKITLLCGLAHTSYLYKFHLFFGPNSEHTGSCLLCTCC